MTYDIENLPAKFEDFLKAKHAEHFAEGTLDDEMPDAYEAWLGDLGREDLDAYSAEFNALNGK